jgi:transposase
MLKGIIGRKTVYIVTGYTDMRKGIDGLAAIVQGKLNLDPYSKALFLFCGRNPRRMKGLLWEGDGFLLLYKRLEDGRFQWPRNATEVINMSPQQYKWLMEGLSIHQKRYVREVYAKQIV